MRKIREAGFSLLMLAIVVAAIGAVGIISVIAIIQIQRSNDPAKTQTTSENTQNQDDDESKNEDSDLVKTYHSTVGKFTIAYPKSWTVTAFKGGQVVPTPDGTEDKLRFQVAADTVKLNNYGGELIISDAAPGDTPWPTYPNGSILQKLPNGIQVWRDNKSQTLQTGIKQNTCPSLRIASNDAFGYKLKSGKFVSFTGSFCWTAGMTTSYTYGQQIISDEFNQTITVFRSIKQD